MPFRLSFKSSGSPRARILPGPAIALFLAIACLGATTDSTAPKSDSQESAGPQPQTPTSSSKPQATQKSNRETAQADAAELASMADQLRDQLQKMNINVFSLGVVQKTEGIEKLAKKIKAEGHAR